MSTMFRLTVVVVYVLTAVPNAQCCELPVGLIGEWSSDLTAWSDVTITNSSITALNVDRKSLQFSCFLRNGSTFILESAEQTVSRFRYHYYICVDIVPSETFPDQVYFSILTEDNPSHHHDPVRTLFSDEDKNFTNICQKEPTQLPLFYHSWYRKGYEHNTGNTDTCPDTLQAEFDVQFSQDLEAARCPQGFVVSGCDRQHLVFNFTVCGANNTYSGSLTYMCLSSVTADNVTYTSVALEQDAAEGETDVYQLACFEQSYTPDGRLSITKSNGTCGATPSVHMLANETLSCRITTTTTTTTTTITTTTATTPEDNEDTDSGSSAGSVVTYARWTAAIMCLLVMAITTAP